MRPSGSVSGGYGGATGNNNNHYSQSLAPPQSPGVGGGGGYTGATMGNGSARGHVLSSVGLSGSTRNSGYPMGPPSPGLASSARGGGGGYPVGPPPLSPGLAGSTRGDVGVIGYSTGPPLPSPGARRYPEQQHMQRQYQEKPKIDPSQIPRPPLFTRPQQDSGQLPVFHPKQAATTTGSSSDGPMMSLPPPAESRYAVQDDGNASPDFIRSSVYAFPLHRGIWHQTGDIPLGIMCTPLASHAEDCVPRPRKLPDGTEQAYKDPQAVPVVGQSTYGPSSEGPPRCSHCFAYVNPFFGPGGTCNLCGHHNRNLPMTGLPVQFGTVEYDVAGPYLTRERGPVQPISLYALDLTCPDIVSYLAILEQVGLDMAEHFNRQRHFSMTGPKPAPPRIGICLVSAAGIVVLPHHNDNSPGHRYAIVSDVTVEPFAPFPLSDWTFDLSTSEGVSAWQNYVRDECTRDLVEWRRYTANFKAVSGADSLELSCGGAALQFMADALAETGGRGTWISWRRPNYGVGSLPCRDHRQQPQQQQHQADETSAYTPLQLLTDFKSRGEEVAAAFYKDLGAACAKNCVSLDVMLHTGARSPQPPLELATLGELCKVTCGKLSWISAFDWHEPLREELTRQVQSFAGWDAVFKVRCSEGIQVKSFFSSGGMLVDTTVGGSLELELSTVTPSTCIAVELEHRVGGIPKDRGLVYVQTAVLYSTQLGKRRVRVSTLAIRTTSVVNETYRSVDFSTMIALLTRSAADYIRKEPNDSASLRAKARDAVYHRCTEILANYRQHTPASTSPMGQLILPEKMQLLPLFCMCLLKSPLLRPSLPRMIPGMHASVLTPTNDERAFYNWHVGQVIPSLAMLMVHPNVFSVLNVDDTVGQWHGPDEVEQVNGFVVMPPTIGPSMESLEDDGVYLVDDGLRIFLYIGRLVAGNVKQALLEGEPTELKQLIEALVYQMRVFSSNTRGSESELRPTWVPIVRVMQQEGHQSLMEADVLNLMVADATAGEKDYVDFLCTLHRRIRERVEGGKG